MNDKNDLTNDHNDETEPSDGNNNLSREDKGTTRTTTHKIQECK